MIGPGRAAVVLYGVLLVLVTMAIVFLFRSREPELATEPVRTTQPNRGVYAGPYRDQFDSPYDSTVRPTRFAFTPHTAKPRCLDHCLSRDLLEHVPDSLRHAGITCRVLVGLHVSTEGRVMETEILGFSGDGACNPAVEAWARRTRWTRPTYEGEQVALWIAQPVDLIIP